MLHKSLHISTTGLVSLQSLDLGYNNISSIDLDAFKYLKNLQTLILRRNSLTTIGAWTEPLLNLKILDISQNLVVQLSETVHLNSVEKLNLADNMLVDITSDNINKMSQVTQLDLSYNKLSRFPSLSAKVVELFMSGNMIKTLDQSSLQGLSSIQVRSQQFF